VSCLRIIFAGGGTGGHLYPAIAIADEVKRLQPDAEILFIGTEGKIESRIVPQRGYIFRKIWISGFYRNMRLNNVLFPLKVIISLMQSISIIKKFKPDVVVGTGGYVSGPVLRAAVMLNVPTLIQEQNSYPGVTTRMLAKKVNEVHLTFESSAKYFKGIDHVFISGNPTRSSLENVDLSEAYKYFGFDESDMLKTVLVFGGSLGAHTINCAIVKCIASLIENGFRVIWQTGENDLELAKEVSKGIPLNLLWISSFIERMDFAYRVSDLVICRAGATTLTELNALGKPAILIPYPHATANHQVENAKTLEEAGAAEIVYNDEAEEKLFSIIIKLSETSRLKEMSRHSKELGKPKAASEIAQRIIKLSGAG